MTRTPARPGAFITFEGGEGAGKSTQLRAVAARLGELGHDVVTTREPGGSPGAEALRELLLFGGHDLSSRAEIMAHFAARCDHVDKLVIPAVSAGRIVLCDRFFDSTMAYQGYGMGYADPALLDLIRSMRQLLAIDPDLTVLFEVGQETGRQRMATRNAGSVTGQIDRYESADTAFHERVAAGFRAIAAEEPARIRTISSENRGVDAVTDEAVSLIETFLEGR